jgi:hypothetical protein
MTTSTRPPTRVPIDRTARVARGARRAIAASTAGRLRRIAWLTAAAAASSLVAACGSAPPSQPGAAPTATVTVTASPSTSRRGAVGITAAGDRSGGAVGPVRRRGRRAGSLPHRDAAPRGG